MTGYVRVDTSNNIADGNVISAADLDNEFDGIQAAFNASTGHNHDGTTGEGAPILVLGPTQDIVVGSSTVTPKTTNTVDIGSSSLKFKDLFLAGNASIGGTLAVTGVATLTAQPILSSLTASRAVFTDGSKGLVSNAITGTGNVVMSASPTLTGTITAEALTTSSTVTLSGGTANGVAYLNGSKVLTTGSAMTLDASGQLGIGLTDTVGTKAAINSVSAGAITQVAGFFNDTGSSATTGQGVRLWLTTRPASGTPRGVYIDALYDGGTNSHALAFSTNASAAAPVERLRITNAGNVGIGTSSPSAVGTRTTVHINGADGAALRLSDAVANAFLDYTDTVGARLFVNAAEPLLLGTNSLERMRIDSSGNVGIGTSSPAFTSGSGLEIERTDANATVRLQRAGTSPSSMEIRSGANTGEIFVTSNSPLLFATNGSERMRIDSSGNLGLGVTPSAWGRTAFEIGVAGASITRDTRDLVLLSNAYWASGGLTYAAGAGAGRFDVGTSGFKWFNAPSGTAGAAVTFTQAMTLDASGNLGVGTTSPGARLHVGAGRIFLDQDYQLTWQNAGTNRARIYGDSGNNLIFENGSGNTERARIDSSGNLLVGTTASGGQSGFAVLKGGSGIETRIEIAHNFGTASGVKYVDFLYATGSIGSITQNGTTAVAYNTSSDYRLKNITGPITTSGAYIDSLNPVEGTWKADGSTFVGLIAHEVQEASRTNVATGVKDGEEMQGMDYSNAELIANLIAEVKALRTRVAALESI